MLIGLNWSVSIHSFDTGNNSIAYFLSFTAFDTKQRVGNMTLQIDKVAFDLWCKIIEENYV